MDTPQRTSPCSNADLGRETKIAGLSHFGQGPAASGAASTGFLGAGWPKFVKPSSGAFVSSTGRLSTTERAGAAAPAAATKADAAIGSGGSGATVRGRAGAKAGLA